MQCIALRKVIQHCMCVTVYVIRLQMRHLPLKNANRFSSFSTLIDVLYMLHECSYHFHRFMSPPTDSCVGGVFRS